LPNSESCFELFLSTQVRSSGLVSNQRWRRASLEGMHMKLILGFALAFAIGAVCRLARIPSPAPNALLGSLLVVAISVGYIAAGRALAQPIHTSPESVHAVQDSIQGAKPCR
jgi:XapX domain-containing protein